MPHADSRGLAVTAASEEAVRHYDATVDAYLAFRADTGEHLKRALGADPGFVLGLVTRGYFMMLFETAAFRERAAKSLAAAEAALQQGEANPRERRHLEALRRWVAGDLAGAIALWDAILVEFPRDVLALKLAQYGHFYLGDAEAMRDSLGRALYAWDEGVSGYGFVLGSYAFALEESGAYAEAERHGKRAVEIHPHDIWAAHAVAHVMEMEGRQREGIAWIDGLDRNWGECHNFRYHILWHRCLFHLDLERYDRVLELYDGEVRPDSTDEYLDITNAAAMLWRLEQAGIAVGERWRELAERSAGHLEDHMLVFADAHYLMSLAAGGETAKADDLLASLRRFAETGKGTEADVTREVGLALCEALLAYRKGDYGAAVDRLLPVRRAVKRVGGSHAQRDVFHRTLIDATLRAGRLDLARALISERLRRHPRHAWNWRAWSRAAEAAGDAAEAAKARSEAERLLASG